MLNVSMIMLTINAFWLLQGVRGIKGPKGHPGDEGLRVAIFQNYVVYFR